MIQRLYGQSREWHPPPKSSSLIIRYSRLAASVLCVTAFIALSALWARSYWWVDSVGWRLYAARMVRLDSMQGNLTFETYANIGQQGRWTRAIPIEDWRAAWERFSGRREPRESPRLGWRTTRTGRIYLFVPHWLLVFVNGTLAAVLLIRPLRFSLRTLMIATTVLAVILGFGISRFR